MGFVFEERPSDSPVVDRVWRATTGDVASFLSIAASSWEMVVTKRGRSVDLTVRGPETRPTFMEISPPSGDRPEPEWVGIVFKHGAFMPGLSPVALVDDSVTLPESRQGSFRLDGSAWDFPTFETADDFVARLLREGLLVQDPVVAAAMAGYRLDVSPRTLQRRVLQATGLTRGGIRAIERAREAVRLLLGGTPIAEVVAACGYSDQPHLTRALRRLVGQTPGELATHPREMSLLFSSGAQKLAV
jgi:AraC-like DNA-binding protein